MQLTPEIIGTAAMSGGTALFAIIGTALLIRKARFDIMLKNPEKYKNERGTDWIWPRMSKKETMKFDAALVISKAKEEAMLDEVGRLFQNARLIVENTFFQKPRQ
jgi:hypothetical protein